MTADSVAKQFTETSTLGRHLRRYLGKQRFRRVWEVGLAAKERQRRQPAHGLDEVFLDALSGSIKPRQLKHGNITRSGFRVVHTNEIGIM